MTTPEERLASLCIVLPEVPRKPDRTPCVGRAGATLSSLEAHDHARLCALQLIAVAKMAVGVGSLPGGVSAEIEAVLHVR